MAIASVGALGSTVSTVAASTLVITTGVDASVGTSIVVSVAVDNNDTTDGDHGEIVSVSDSVSNTYTELHEWQNAQAGPDTGVTAAVFVCNVTTALVAGASITITFLNSKACRAAEAWLYSSASTLVLDGIPAHRADDAASPGSMTITGLTSIEHLFIRTVGSESRVATWTVTAGWTSGGVAIADTAVGNTSIAVRNEWQIATSSTATSAPTSGIQDQTSILVALKETALPPPTTGRRKKRLYVLAGESVQRW